LVKKSTAIGFEARVVLLSMFWAKFITEIPGWASMEKETLFPRTRFDKGYS